MKRLFIAIFAIVMLASCAPKELTPTQKFEQALTDSVKVWWQNEREFLLGPFDELQNKMVSYVYVDSALWSYTSGGHHYLDEINHAKKKINDWDEIHYKFTALSLRKPEYKKYVQTAEDSIAMYEGVIRDAYKNIEQYKIDNNKGYIVKFECSIPESNMTSAFKFVIVGDTLCSIPALHQDLNMMINTEGLTFKNIQ